MDAYINPYELLQIQRFKQRLQSLGVLFWVYNEPTELNRQIYNHLPKTVSKIISASSNICKIAHKNPPQFLQKSIEDWQGKKNVYPQWSDYLPIPLEKFKPKSFSIEGTLYSKSPYFRFGFKLFPLEGKVFGDSAIQSQSEGNLLIHVGKNCDNGELFLTSYYNGVRQGLNKPLLDYAIAHPVRLSLKVAVDDTLVLLVDNNEVYRQHISKVFTERLIIVAWGDEHEFEVQFLNIILTMEIN